MVGGERLESWSSYEGSEDKKQIYDFEMQPISNSPFLHINEWKGQFMISIEDEVQVQFRVDRTHSLNEERQVGVRGGVTLFNLQFIKDSLMKSKYLCWIRDRDYASEFAKEAISAFQGKGGKVGELALKLESTKDTLENA